MIDLILSIESIYKCAGSEHALELAGVGHGAHGGVGHCTEFSVLGHQILPVQSDERAHVACEVAVVGGAEDGNASAVVGLFVALVLHLM